MKKGTFNFIVDFIMFVDFLGLLFIAFIIRYVLPPGSGGCGLRVDGGWGRGLGREVKVFWSLSRHQWGDIHFYMALLFMVLVTGHILLHWTWIKSYFKSLFFSHRM